MQSSTRQPLHRSFHDPWVANTSTIGCWIVVPPITCEDEVAARVSSMPLGQSRGRAIGGAEQNKEHMSTTSLSARNLGRQARPYPSLEGLCHLCSFASGSDRNTQGVASAGIASACTTTSGGMTLTCNQLHKNIPSGFLK